MNNIVIVNQSGSKYLFSVPESIQLKEGDKVKCDTARGVTDGVCFTDSTVINTSALPLICKLTGAKLPLKEVVGKTITEVQMFEKPVEEPSQPAQPEKVENKYKVGNLAKIVANHAGHTYEIGEKVVVDGAITDTGCKVKRSNGTSAIAPYVSWADIEPTTPEPTLYVTRKMLENLGACSSGRAEFDSKFPSGKGEFEAVKLATNPSNSHWLTEHKSQIAAMQDEKDEPIRLYCVKDFTNCFGKHALTKGKIYEFDGHKVNYDEIACAEFKSFESWKALDHSYAERLIPLVRRNAKVGEWVRITSGDSWHGNTYREGDIFQITSISEINPNRCYHNRGTEKELFLDAKEYLVLEGYTLEPEKEPEPVYFSGKVVCTVTDGDGTFTVGKVYEFVDGQVLDNKSYKRPTGMKMKSLNDGYLANWYYRFIPYLGEA